MGRQFRKLKIRTNSETPADSKTARENLVQRELVFVEQSICFLMRKEFYL